MCVLYKMMSSVYLVNERKVQISFCWIRKIKNVRCVVCFGFILLHFGFKYLLALTDTLTYNQINWYHLNDILPNDTWVAAINTEDRKMYVPDASQCFHEIQHQLQYLSYTDPFSIINISIISLTDRQTDGWTDEQTYGRRKDRQTVGQTERERGIEE